MQPLLITGSMRSGTTLLANLLDAQEGIEVKRDFLHVHRIQRRLGGVAVTQPLGPAERALTVEVNDLFNGILEIDHAVAAEDFGTLEEFYRHVLNTAYAPGSRIRGHKTTEAFLILEELLRAVPALKVVCIFRDPRDVVASTLKRWPERSWAVTTRQWEEAFRITRRLQEAPAFRNRVALVHFEDLLRDSDAVMEQLSAFLNAEIGVPDALEDYGGRWTGNSSFERGGSSREGGGAVLSTAPIGRWKEADPALGRKVEAYCYDALMEAGYEPSAVLTPQRKVLAGTAAAASHAKHRLKGVARQLLGRERIRHLKRLLPKRS